MTSNDASATGAGNNEGDGNDPNAADPNAQGGGEGQGGSDGGDGGDGGGEVRDPEQVLADNRKKNEENAQLRTRLKEFEDAAEAQRKAALTEHESAIESAREEAAAEERGVWESRLLSERVRTLATGVFIDPEDAVTYTDLDGLSIDDQDGIVDALNALAKAKPHLIGGGRKGGTIDQGPQGHAHAPQSGNDWIRKQIGR